MSRLRHAKIAVRTLWIAGLAVRLAGYGTGVVAWVALAFLGVDLVVTYIEDPGRLRRPTRSEMTSSLFGVLTTAILIVLALVLAVLLVSN